MRSTRELTAHLQKRVRKDEDLTKVEKVPVLGDIPYLGTLFESTASTQQKSETLIFITPRILSEALVN